MLKNRRHLTVLVLVVTIIACGFVVKITMDSKSRSSLSPADTQLSSTEQSNNDEQVNNSQQLNNAEQTTDQETQPQNEVADKKPEVITYVVKTGDTLEAIASRFNVTADTIAGSNGISKDAIIREGQELKFPSVKGLIYKIKSGDTLSDIVSTYEVNMEDIISSNGIETPDKLKIGQEIIIPGVDKLKVAVKETQVSAKKTASTSVKVASRGSSSGSSSSKAVSASGSMWPVKGTITSKFGARWGTTHKGIDIAAPTGTNVYAFMSGKVVFSGWEGGYGKLVIIDHGNGLQSYYGHNSKLIVSSGQSVSKGQHIADVGSTGDSTGPHCHFEIRKNGKAVNPLDYLN